MIVDENLNDCSESCFKQLLAISRCLIIMTIIIFVLLGISVFNDITTSNTKNENTLLKEQLEKDENTITLESSIGYWFINTPEEVNDSLLYQLLIDNNAWFPDILLAQAKLESGNYTSNVYKNTNNLYGMRKVGKRQTTQLNGTYHGYGMYSNWCESTLDRLLWDMFTFSGNKPTKEEYLKAMNIYAEDLFYVKKLL